MNSEYKVKVLGKNAILEQMKQGAYLYRVSGKFGGWGIENTVGIKYATVRKDSCSKLATSGLLKATEHRSGYVKYELK